MPTGTIVEPIEHSFFSPPFEEGQVHQAIRLGIFSCERGEGDLPLADVARMMATGSVQPRTGHPVGALSTLDVAGVLASGAQS